MSQSIEAFIAGVPGAMDAAERGAWPEDYFTNLLGPVALWAEAGHPVQFHHTGFTYPNSGEFQTAVDLAAEPGDTVYASDMVTPVALHHRRYTEAGSADNGEAWFWEHHKVGDEGDGVRGVHFDFITDEPGELLEIVRNSITPATLEEVQIVTKAFGGGNNPVGKVGLQPQENPNLEVGVMTRSHWTHPQNW